MDSTPRILVSHSHQDNAWCAAFVAGLRARGADVWYDEQNLGFGVLRDEIERQMRARPIFIVVLSPHSVASGWVQREVDAAIYLLDAERRLARKHQDGGDNSRVVLPVLAEDCDVPLLWNSFRRVTGPDGAPLTPGEAVDRVAQALNITPASAAVLSPTTHHATATTAADQTPSASVAGSSGYHSGSGVAGSPGTPESAAADGVAHGAEPGNAIALAADADGAFFSRSITDIVDERGKLLVHYPTWFVVMLAATGVIAFLLVGLFGYRDGLESAVTAEIFRQPWPLFLWFCALLITLQVSVFRSPLVRQQRLAGLGVTVATSSIVIAIGIIYVSNYDVARLFSKALSLIHINVPPLGATPWTYAVVNFGVLCGYGISVIVRRARGKGDWRVPSPSAEQTVNAETYAAKRLEGFAASLFTGAALALVMSLCMQPVVVNLAAALLQTNVLLTTCTISWPLGSCSAFAGGSSPPSLALIDQVIALVLLEHGILLLLVAGVPRRPGAVAGPRFATLRWVLSSLLATVVALPRSLRVFLWPVLTMLSVYLVAATSRGIQSYLHLLSDRLTCRSPATCGGDAFYQAVQAQIAAGGLYQSFGLAIFSGIVATLCAVLSLAIQASRGRVARNALLFLRTLLGPVALLVLTTFWIFALALSGCSALLNLTGLSDREPFPEPGVSTIISFVFAVGYLVFRGLRSARRRALAQA